MKMYINAASAISPQHTFQQQFLLNEPVEYINNILRVVEPDYRNIIDAKLLRRMSRIVRMGIASAKDCLNKANIVQPSAIITGTAYGCLEDSDAFTKQLIAQDEQMLSPTAFIQSTHNTVAAQIALMLRCHAYNNTFVHRGFSFEHALMDATLLMQEGDADNVLVGGIDELSETSYGVLKRLGLYRREETSNLALFSSNIKGTLAGEGAAFFALSQQQQPNTIAKLLAVKTLYKPNDVVIIQKTITDFLSAGGLSIDDIDVIITGKNGNVNHDKIYRFLNENLFGNKTICNYKHLCGEYPTSISFALWLAVNMIKRQELPSITIEKKSGQPRIKNILIYNHSMNTHHSMMLVSSIDI
jgi:3-oxoacyl-(acyl-carrier-protein) synthase